MQKQQYEIHPAATLFPLMTEDEFEGLKQDIAKNGQREDIVVWCGKLIDGRNRLRACEELQRTPSIAELDEDQDPWKYVISHNLHRRHLTTSQRAMVASKLANMRQGEGGPGRAKVSNDTIAMDDAAKQLNVGRATVARAKQVQEHGSESVRQAVEQGSLPVSLAAKLVKEVPDKKEQAKIVAKGTKEVRDTLEPHKEVLEWVNVDDEQSVPPKSTSKKATGCKNCERLREELKQSYEDLKTARRQRDDTMQLCASQTTMISDLVDQKEHVGTIAKPTAQKPTGWISPPEVVVSVETKTGSRQRPAVK
jgi:hypothetical protein